MGNSSSKINGVPRSMELLGSEDIFSPRYFLIYNTDRDDTVYSKLQEWLNDQEILRIVYGNYLAKYKQNDEPHPAKRIRRDNDANIETFKNNLLQIAYHNVEFGMGQETYRRRVDQFTDEDPAHHFTNTTGDDQFKNFYKALQKSVPVPSGSKVKDHSLNTKEFDWCEKGMVTSVDAQGESCGSCYIFASVGALESAHAIRNNKKPPTKLSAQQILDCGKIRGCDGGDICQLLEDMKTKGVTSERDYGAYRAAQGTCKTDMPVRARVESYAHIPEGDEEALKKAVTICPVAAGVCSDGWHGYDSGVFEPKGCGRGINHAVIIVGFGQDESGGEYWIVKNSWGEGWGETGYLRLRMGKNACQIANYAFSVKAARIN